MFRKLSTSVLLLLLGTPLMALAQGTGTLAGRVTDADTGEGLPGANVIVVSLRPLLETCGHNMGPGRA